MICVALCAGYATRLYPLTENFPKALLEVRGKTILDWLYDDICASAEISRFVVVSNHRYAPHFSIWAQEKTAVPVTVLDDGTISNETRLGAVRDVLLAVEQLSIDEDVLVVAGDNVLDFSLGLFTAYFREKNASCLMRYFCDDEARLKKGGVLLPGADDRILRMEEKPEIPFATYCAPPFYVYARKDLHFLSEALEAGCGADAPGSFMAWLSKATDVYAMEMPGRRYDIGTLATYQEVQDTYQGIQRTLTKTSHE